MRTGNPEGARSMRRVWKQLLAGVLAFGVFGAASAYTLTITPADQTTTVGSQIGIGITASDFGVAGGLGAYNLDLSFEAGVLGFDRVVDGLGMGTVAQLVVAAEDEAAAQAAIVAGEAGGPLLETDEPH